MSLNSASRAFSAPAGSRPRGSEGSSRGPRAARPSRWLAAILVAAPLAAACDNDEAACTGPEILPHESPARLGYFRPLGNQTPNPGAGITVPYEWTLFLRSTCSTPLVIEKVCIVGDAHNGDEDDTSFTFEGPVPSTIANGQAGAVRLTYDNDQVNQDLDDDGKRDPDNIAVVVQSNAKNFPTLVVPVCAMILPDDEEPFAFSCTSPITVPAGQKDTSLCAD